MNRRPLRPRELRNDPVTLITRVGKQAQKSACGRKRAYATLADAEIDMPPTQAPYRCMFGDHWHRVTRRDGP